MLPIETGLRGGRRLKGGKCEGEGPKGLDMESQLVVRAWREKGGSVVARGGRVEERHR